MNTPNVMEVLNATADAVATAYGAHQGKGYSGQRETQYHLDLAADAAALDVLLSAGYRVVSEESGVSGSGSTTVVVDPIDGSTNCDRGIPFFATSLAVLHDGVLVAALVVNQATGVRYSAERGSGAFRDGAPIRPSGLTTLDGALVSFSGHPERHLGWGQIRALGAASLECCLVADGSLDAFTVAQRSTLRSWDYLAGLLVAQEAGATTLDYAGEDLIFDGREPRRPIFAGSQELAEILLGHGPL